MMIERRTYLEGVELRAGSENALIAAGYAAVFDKRSEPLGGFVERIAPSAFNKTVQEADVRALFNHDPSLVLGRSKSGTLRLGVDEVGLRFEIDLPDTRTGHEVGELLRRGDISGSSFGFRIVNGGEEWGETEDGYPLRTLTEVRLFDVGPVTFPAYSDTEAALRSLAEARSLDLSTLVAAAQCGELRNALAIDSEKKAAQSAPSARLRLRY